jgi:hypothetical protein
MWSHNSTPPIRFNGMLLLRDSRIYILFYIQCDVSKFTCRILHHRVTSFSCSQLPFCWRKIACYFYWTFHLASWQFRWQLVFMTASVRMAKYCVMQKWLTSRQVITGDVVTGGHLQLWCHVNFGRIHYIFSGCWEIYLYLRERGSYMRKSTPRSNIRAEFLSPLLNSFVAWFLFDFTSSVMTGYRQVSHLEPNRQCTY